MKINQYLEAIDADEQRDSISLHLTANEALVSQTAKRYMTSGLADRYYFGGGDDEGVVDFGPSTYRGMKGIQSVVTEASEELKRMLGASHVNLSPLSGIYAMICAILVSTKPGDTVMAVDLAHGGHFSTKPIIENMGRNYIPTAYDYDAMKFDAIEIGRAFRASKATALYLDVSFYIKPHNLREIREQIGSEAIIIYDASHTIGLIMGGLFQDPFAEGADIICANTHKTLPGPQKGLIAFKDDLFGERANGIINGGLFSSPHTATTIALAITILEMANYGREYAAAVVANANALAGELKRLGYTVREAEKGTFTFNHQVHLFTDELGQYRELYRVFAKNNMSVNFADTLGGHMFMRLGTQEITRRGMREPEMVTIASFIDRCLNGETGFADEIEEFVSRYKRVQYSFDNEAI